MDLGNSNLYVLDNIIHFGLDHLEIYGSCKHENELFNKLDFDNSNYGELEDYSFTKNEVPKYQYKIIFTKDNYSLFAYYKGDFESNSIIKSKDKLVIYSTAFKLLSYDEIIYFIEGYFILNKVYRFDICIDINLNIETILNNFNILNTGKEYKKFGVIESRYIGDNNKYKNKRQVIRVYNKKVDIEIKNKHKLYKEYLAENHVTRIELEIRSELAKNISYTCVFDNLILTRIFKNYLQKHTNLFDFKNIENLTLYRKPSLKINSNEYESLFYKMKRKAVFEGHAKSIFELGFCPVRTLIAKGFMQPETEKILGGNLVKLFKKMEAKLKKIAINNIYKRKDYDNLVSNYKKNG